MTLPASPPLAFLDGGGGMGARIRALDWSATPLGPPQGWPQALRAMVTLMLGSRQPMFVVWGPEATLLYNDAYVPILGAKHPAALGRPMGVVWHEIWPQVRTLVERAYAGESLWHEDLLVPLVRNGYLEDVWFTFSYTPVRDDVGAVAGMFCAVMETTAQVRARQRTDFHLELESRLRVLTDPLEVIAAAEEALGRHLGASRVGYGFVDPTQRYFTTERNWTDGTVRPQVGTHDLEAFGPEVLAALRSGEPMVLNDAATDPRTTAPGVREAFVALEAASVITASLVKQGRMIAALYVHVRTPRRWHADEVALVQEVAERTWSAFERAHAQEALRTSEQRLRIAQEAGGVGTFELRGDGMVTVSEEFCRLWGIPPRPAVPVEEVVHLIHPDDRPRLNTLQPGQVPTEGLGSVEYRILRPSDGTERWIARRGQAVADGAGENARVIGVCYDITDRKRAEQALQDLNATLERRIAERTADRDRIWRLSTDIMLVARFDGTVVAVNPAWTTLLGWTEEELTRFSFLDLVHPDDRAATADESARLSAGLTTLRFENRYRHRDGSYRWISWTAVPDESFIHAVGRDVTARKEADAALQKAEEQLRQAQKMEAVGQLTGGVAHDFNNLLQALSGCLTMIGRRTDEPKVKPLLEAGMQAVERGAKLVQQLMGFARRGSLRPEPIDVRDRVLAMSGLLERALRADIRLETRFPPDLWPIEADPTQFELALINLAVNARDAMPGAGRLSVEAANVTLPPGDASGRTGDFVRLSVADTGSGMPAEVLAKAFDPFFTTKEVGKGSGLGLAQVYGLARQAGGTAWIDSAEGRGTTIHLLLRRSAEAPRAATVVGLVDTPRPDGASVLVVEDDPVVASTVAAALEDEGWRVLRVATADEALPLLAGDARIDLLFSDVVMPGRLNGIELAQEARALRPGMPVVLTTGYSEDVARTAGIKVLSKPYRIQDLAQALHAAMADKARATERA